MVLLDARENVINKKRRFTASFFVGLPGFEPRQTEPKSVVLPLYYRPIPIIFSDLGVQK